MCSAAMKMCKTLEVRLMLNNYNLILRSVKGAAKSYPN